MMAARLLQFFPAIWLATPVMAAETIVGRWGPVGSTCRPVDGLVSVGPKSLTTDDLACRFGDVSRDADVVTWRGTCSDGRSREPATVVAALYDGWLTVSLNGRRWTPSFRRCTKTGEPIPPR